MEQEVVVHPPLNTDAVVIIYPGWKGNADGYNQW